MMKITVRSNGVKYDAVDRAEAERLVMTEREAILMADDGLFKNITYYFRGKKIADKTIPSKI